MIDMAPVAAAPQDEMTEIAPDAVDALPVESQTTELPDAPESTALPSIEPETATEAVPDAPEMAEMLPEPAPPLTPPPVIPPDSPPSEIAELRPVSRPQDFEPLPESQRQAEREDTPAEAAPAQAARRARVADAAPAETAAAPVNTRQSGARSAESPARWSSRVLAHLERRKRYPSSARRRGEEGVAYVQFSIDSGGNVLSAGLARSSGYAALDKEVIAMVRRASPIPAPPPDAPRNLTVPVQFQVR
jgi:periplasmic protein TonB